MDDVFSINMLFDDYENGGENCYRLQILVEIMDIDDVNANVLGVFALRYLTGEAICTRSSCTCWRFGHLTCFRLIFSTNSMTWFEELFLGLLHPVKRTTCEKQKTPYCIICEHWIM